MARLLQLALLGLAGSSQFVNGFVGPSTPAVSSSTKLNLRTTTGWDSFEDIRRTEDFDLLSGEGQRKFRRTVYTHDDWKKQRSQDRFFYYVSAILTSSAYKNLEREVLAVTAVSAFVVFYNGLVGGYTDPFGVEHTALLNFPWLLKLTLPMNAFTLTSPSLGLLLGKSQSPINSHQQDLHHFHAYTHTHSLLCGI